MQYMHAVHLHLHVHLPLPLHCMALHYIEITYLHVSRPTPVSSYVATVDFEGYLHLLSQVDGQIVGRSKIGGDAARADMIADSGRLIIYADNGQLLAYELEAQD